MKRGIVLGCFLVVRFASGADLFSSKIEPLLKQRCYECHSHEKKIKGGLALDSKSGWEKGGESGPAIVPGKPEASLLIQAVSHVEKDLKMPPKTMLPAAEIALLTEWVRQGAPDPRTAAPSTALNANNAWEVEFQKRLDWWSLKPMRPATTSSVDSFIQATQKAAGLEMAPQASPEVLRRRLSFVLTGLPPSAFDVPESSLEAYAESLLASPRFGEHFARHWMDVVRYTDTYGYEWDNPAKGSHEYRDYLIRAFNDDIGFDQLVREQLAGDLLPKPRIHPKAQTNESLIGPMFYHMGEHRHGSSLMFNGIHQEMVNNKIDAFSKAFLATTVACARCHDHKLEAVSQRDYYALAAMFTTPRWTPRVIDAPGKNDAAIARLKELRSEIREEVAALWFSRDPFHAEGLKRWAAENRASLEKAAPHEPAYPLLKLLAGTPLTDLAAEWRKLRDEAKAANAVFSPLADPAKGRLPDGWVSEGDGIRHGWVEEGEPLVSLEGETIVARLLPAGWHTHALSPKLPGTLRVPPQAEVPGKTVSLKVAGGEFGGHLVVDDHAFQNETVAFYTNATPEWKSFPDAVLKNGAQEVTIEFCTSSLNPNFPPRTGLAKGLPNQDFGHDKRSWISITGIVSHDAGGSPRNELDGFRGLHERAPAADPWTAVAAWCNEAVRRWCAGTPQPGDPDVINWLLGAGLLPNHPEPGTPLADRVAEYRRVEASIGFPRTVNSMDERESPPASYPLNVRGNPDVTGELVAPASLRMLKGEQVTNRLALADSLLEPGHPLTARVYVNRVWQWIFGTGLVATPDDFGRLGDRPSHPELLDWLASEFVRDGWSTKRLVRRLVLSETFRQSGEVASAARDLDPANRLLHHYPTRRLEAESIRDALLAVSGRLDPALYGRPILPYRTATDGAKRLFSGPLDGNGRRSLYLQMSIMDPPKFLVGFNLPDLKLPAGRRDVTNVPAQALVLLNDPFVRAMAERWATEVLKEPHRGVECRIEAMFLRAFGRVPDSSELARWRDWISGADGFGGDVMKSHPVWTEVAHALFNTKEFIHHR